GGPRDDRRLDPSRGHGGPDQGKYRVERALCAGAHGDAAAVRPRTRGPARPACAHQTRPCGGYLAGTVSLRIIVRRPAPGPPDHRTAKRRKKRTTSYVRAYHAPLA